MKTWIKLYTEALHDRKMRRMNRVDKSIFYDLLLLAGQEDMNGYLPSYEDIALELDLKETEARKAIDRLIEAGVITKVSDEKLLITNFEKRQSSNASGYERIKRYRDNKRNVINDNANDNANDTKMITVEEDIDKDIEEEKEEDIDIKKEKKNIDAVASKPQKHQYGEYHHVLLTDEEHTKLCEKFPHNIGERIQRLDDYLENNRKKHYDNHYLTILNWARKDEQEKPQPQQKRLSAVELVALMDERDKGVIDL